MGVLHMRLWQPILYHRIVHTLQKLKLSQSDRDSLFVYETHDLVYVNKNYCR